MAPGETGKKPYTTRARSVREAGPPSAQPLVPAAVDAQQLKDSLEGRTPKSQASTQYGLPPVDSGGFESTAYAEYISAGGTKRPPIRGPPTRAAFTIPEFCLAHDLSQAFYYKLKAQGLGPTEMKIGSRRLVSFEAAAAWRRAREAAST